MTEITIAVVGLGTVGRSFLRYLENSRDFSPINIRVGAVADSTGFALLDGDSRVAELVRHKESGCGVDTFCSGSERLDPQSFVSSISKCGIKVLVESLPTNLQSGEPALSLIESSLRSGLHVVTCDKGPVVCGYKRLIEAASRGSSNLGFTGTTGVALPEVSDGDPIVEIRGVLNGTSNYILSAMQENDIPYSEALEYARSEGIAEPNPALDVQGWDTAAKILILAKALMGAEATIGEVACAGIETGIQHLLTNAKATGRIVRLIGRSRIWQGRVRVSVAPKLLTPDSPFYEVSGSSKAAAFKCSSGREMLIHGVSGRNSIARILLEDVLRVSGLAVQ